jgi:hypothetical protein
MVGASFTVAAVAEVLRSKKGITAVGSAVIGTAQSKFGGSSYYGNGASNYLLASVYNKAAVTDFTFECWLRIASTANAAVMLFQGYPLTGNKEFYVVLTGAEANRIYLGSSAGYQFSSWTPSLNVWYHIALTVDSSGNAKFWVDGTQQGSTKTGVTIATVIGNSDADPLIAFGRYQQSNLSALNGYMDEIRLSNSVRYTTTFTPSTTPFVNDANTLLLIHANGTDASTFFEDDNGVRASRSLIAIGNAQVDTAQSKFGGASALFDGTGDYLLSPAGTQWDFSTSSFTIEYWIRFNAINTLYVPIALRPGASIGVGQWWCEITAAENKMYWGFKNQAGTQYYVNLALAGTAFATGQFYHIALVNNAGTAQMYVNGTATGATTALSGSFGISTTDLWVGAGAGAYSVNGWMDEVRISNSARYTTTFTPSTTPFVNDTNTLLLIHADGTDTSTVFTDDNGTGRSARGISAIGNAQVDTAQSKFGGASALFDGSGDYLLVSPASGFNFGTDNFTVEAWYRINTIDLDMYLISFVGGPLTHWGINIYSNNWRAGLINDPITGNTGIATGTWYHAALVRDSATNLTFYINGTSVGTKTINASDNFTPTVVAIAQYSVNLGYNAEWNGHIDEVRVSNTARYTANFTAPSAPFQNDANTLLLLHMDGTDASTAFFDDNGIAPYTP